MKKLSILLLTSAFLLASCANVEPTEEQVSETPAEEAEPTAYEFPEFTTPEGWITIDHENVVSIENDQYSVGLSYQEPEMANGLDDYDSIGVTQAGVNSYETYSKIFGPKDPVASSHIGPEEPDVSSYVLVLDGPEGKLYVDVGWGEEALQDEDVLLILSSLTYGSN